MPKRAPNRRQRERRCGGARSAEEQHDFTQVVTLDLRLLAKLNAQPVGVLQERPQRSCVRGRYSAHPAAYVCVRVCVSTRVQASTRVREECACATVRSSWRAPTSGDENASVLSSGIRHLSGTAYCAYYSLQSREYSECTRERTQWARQPRCTARVYRWDASRVHGGCKLHSRQPYRSPHSRSSRLNSRETATT